MLIMRSEKIPSIKNSIICKQEIVAKFNFMRISMTLLHEQKLVLYFE